MIFTFNKMHNLGNDFIIINTLSFSTTEKSTLDLTAANLRFVADRHVGIGCDQILILEEARSSDADFYCRIFNCDGSEAEMSGNGMLSLAKLIYTQQLTSKKIFVIATCARKVTAYVTNAERITVEMGMPNFTPSQIPFIAQQQELRYLLRVAPTALLASTPTVTAMSTAMLNKVMAYEEFSVGVVSMGNPHIVLQVDDVMSVDVKRIGALLASHPLFPQGANVNFMQILSADCIRLRTYERGTGATLACGSGSCAAVAIGRVWQLLNKEVTVCLQLGNLMVEWRALNFPLLLTGTPVEVFRGEMAI